MNKLVIFCFFLTILLYSCGTVKTYHGETLPEQEVAIIFPKTNWFIFGDTAFFIKEVDGENVGASMKAEVLPGKHTVTIVHQVTLGLTSTVACSADLEFYAEAGRRYKAGGRNLWDSNATERYAYIKDVDTGLVMDEKPCLKNNR